jgi:phenolic acid decarboxylase
MAEKIEWVSVGALGEAFQPDNNTLDTVADLGGKSFFLDFENGWSVEYVFTDARTLRWEIKCGDKRGESAEEAYTATKPREGIYFVDFIKSKERATSVSLVLDQARGVFTAVIGEMPTKEEAEEPFLRKIALGKTLTSVRTTIVRGTIDKPFSMSEDHHQRTSDLIGRRVRYVYSPTETYEHIYLNPEFYTWHCISGIENGLCDTDYCHYYRIDSNLYLFVWQEKIVPTLGVVMIDFDRLKTTGKIFGYTEYDFNALTNFSVGAYAAVVNTVPEEMAP